ncbi:hypothetical protein ABZP36_014305 [Zizania latifolia]
MWAVDLALLRADEEYFRGGMIGSSEWSISILPHGTADASIFLAIVNDPVMLNSVILVFANKQDTDDTVYLPPNPNFRGCRVVTFHNKREVKAAGNVFGNYFLVATYGESHGGGVGCVISGCPPRIPLTEADIQVELDRKAPRSEQNNHPKKGG